MQKYRYLGCRETVRSPSQRAKYVTKKSHARVDSDDLAYLGSGALVTMLGFIGGNPSQCESALLRPSNIIRMAERVVLPAEGECSARRIRCNANASNDRHFPRLLG